MVRLQMKITCQASGHSENTYELMVWERSVPDQGDPSPWKRVLVKSTYVDPMVYTGGRRLRVLLRSLA